jgi:hypothetical protein
VARSACAEGNCHVIEGTVEQLQAVPDFGASQKNESFTVGNVRFHYSGYEVTHGFNQMVSAGGPIREGLPVRVTYADGVILKLEVLDGATVASARSTSPPLPFFPFLILAPIAIAIISLLGGWFALSRRYPSDAPLHGRKFAMQSAFIGAFGGSYSRILDITVGDEGFSLVPMFLFRFLHPSITIRWRDVADCRRSRFLLSRRTVVRLADGRTISVYDPAGEAIFETWRHGVFLGGLEGV